MSLLAKSLSAGLAAALLTAAPLLDNSAAGASAKAARHGTQHASSVADRLAGLRRGSTHAAGAQVKAIADLIAQEADAPTASAGPLDEALAADLAVAQADQDGLAQAATASEIHALMRAANTTRHIAQLRFSIVRAADAAGAEAMSLSLTVAGLQGQLADLPGDNSAALAMLADAASLLETVSAQVPGVIAFVLLVPSDADRAQLHDATVSVNQALESIEGALADAAADVAAVQAAL